MFLAGKEGHGQKEKEGKEITWEKSVGVLQVTTKAERSYWKIERRD